MTEGGVVDLRGLVQNSLEALVVLAPVVYGATEGLGKMLGATAQGKRILAALVGPLVCLLAWQFGWLPDWPTRESALAVRVGANIAWNVVLGLVGSGLAMFAKSYLVNKAAERFGSRSKQARP